MQFSQQAAMIYCCYAKGRSRALTYWVGREGSGSGYICGLYVASRE
jgi:hypothetical protein